MDMAPRWAGGYGIQLRWESFSSDSLVRGSSKVANPLGLKKSANNLWLEGIYSFTREHRISFKLPYHFLSKTIEDGGKSKTLNRSGVGDLILGFINKHYFNKPGWTGNLSFTPSIKIPTGQSGGALTLGTGVVDYGLSLSVNVESFAFYGLIDWFGWLYSEQSAGKRPGNLMGLDIDLGIHPIHNNESNSGIFLMVGWNTRWIERTKTRGVIDANTGGIYTEIVPTLVWYKRNVMVRAQYHMPIIYDLNGTQSMPFSGFQLGAGITF